MAKVMITGASGGLGAAIAGRFATRGDDLVLLARRRPLLEALGTELLAAGAATVEARPVDLADARQVDQLAESLEEAEIDVLINNAALGQWDYSWNTTPEKLCAMIDVNVRALARLSVAFAHARYREPARLMNVASGAGYALFESSIPYSATKFFVTALTEGIARELRSQNHPMRAQLLAPGPIATEFMANAMEDSSMNLEASKLDLQDSNGVRFHSADEVAEFAMQLYDSDATVGAVQPDMTFKLGEGRHPVGQLFEASW